jgi:hypothetical protein
MDGVGQVQAVLKTATMVLSNTKWLKEQACNKRYGRFVHVMSELWRRHNGSRMRRGVAVGLTQAETLKPGLLAEGCLATMSEGVIAVYKKQRHSNARRMLLSVAAKISNCSRRMQRSCLSKQRNILYITAVVVKLIDLSF